QAYPHAALHAPLERQGRALHPHPPRRMGLRQRLARLTRPRPLAPKLHPLLQPPTTTQLTRRTATHQPRSQPPWAVQLAREPVEQQVREEAGDRTGLERAARPVPLVPPVAHPEERQRRQARVDVAERAVLDPPPDDVLDHPLVGIPLRPDRGLVFVGELAV